MRVSAHPIRPSGNQWYAAVRAFHHLAPHSRLCTTADLALPTGDRGGTRGSWKALKGSSSSKALTSNVGLGAGAVLFWCLLVLPVVLVCTLGAAWLDLTQTFQHDVGAPFFFSIHVTFRRCLFAYYFLSHGHLLFQHHPAPLPCLLPSAFNHDGGLLAAGVPCSPRRQQQPAH